MGGGTLRPVRRSDLCRPSHVPHRHAGLGLCHLYADDGGLHCNQRPVRGAHGRDFAESRHPCIGSRLSHGLFRAGRGRRRRRRDHAGPRTGRGRRTLRNRPDHGPARGYQHTRSALCFRFQPRAHPPGRNQRPYPRRCEAARANPGMDRRRHRCRADPCRARRSRGQRAVLVPLCRRRRWAAGLPVPRPDRPVLHRLRPGTAGGRDPGRGLGTGVRQGAPRYLRRRAQGLRHRHLLCHAARRDLAADHRPGVRGGRPRNDHAAGLFDVHRHRRIYRMDHRTPDDRPRRVGRGLRDQDRHRARCRAAGNAVRFDRLRSRHHPERECQIRHRPRLRDRPGANDRARGCRNAVLSTRSRDHRRA